MGDKAENKAELMEDKPEIGTELMEDKPEIKPENKAELMEDKPEIKIEKKYLVRAGICAFFLLVIGLIATDTYKKLPGFRENVLRIGVFSDSYWEVQNGYAYQIVEDAIARFEEQHPGIRVEYVSGIIKEDYSKWLSVQVMKGEAPDVFFVLGEDFNDFAQAGVLKNLDSLIKEDEGFLQERYYSSAYAYGSYEGGQYALPFACAPKLMFVNKSILEKEGITLPENHWTWDDFYRICREVTKDTDKDGMPDQFGTVGYTWEDAFDSNGVQLFDEKGKECYLTDKKAGVAISFIEKMEELNEGYNVSSRDFALGNVVFQPMLFSEYRAYKSYPLSIKKYAGFAWDCLMMPSGPDGENISRLDTLLLAINPSTMHSKEAWEMMKLLTGDEKIQSEIFTYSEGVSVLKEVVEAEKNQQFFASDTDTSHVLSLSMLSNAVEQAVVIPRFHNYDNAVAEVDRAIQAILQSSSNINMETIIQNRKINHYLNH